MGLFLQDLRYSVRKIFRRPILSLVIVLSMGIGIGATTIVYGVIQGALLRPYIFPEIERLMFIWADLPNFQSKTEVISAPEYLALDELTDIIESRGSGDGTTLTLAAGAGEPERLRGMRVTPSLFPTLGVEPVAGRWLIEEDTKRTTNPAVVLSYRLWQRRFGGDPEVVGRTIPMSEIPYTVVGVMPPRFRFGRSDFWQVMPIGELERTDRSLRFLWTPVRLKDGVSRQQANAALEVLARRLEDKYGGETREYENWSLLAEPLREYFIGDVKPGLWMLLSAVAFVLLIVCLNVANLLLARSFAREREIATRITLGSGRFRMIRLMLIESMVLVVLGGGCGLLFSYWGLGFVGARFPDEYLPAVRLFGLDTSSMLLTLGVTLLAGLFVGAIPALQTSRPNLQESLKEGGRSMAGGRRGRLLLNALVVLEVAAALVLLVGLNLVTDGFEKLQQRDLGFDPENLMTFHVDLPRARYNEAQVIARFWDDFERRVQALPGIEAAGAVTMLPLEEYVHQVTRFALEAAEEDQPEERLETVIYGATAGFFQAMRHTPVQGRLINDQDGPGTLPVVVVNEAFVRRFLPNGDPLTRRIRFGPPQAPWISIVGVIRDSIQRRVTEPAEPAAYFAFAQYPYFTWTRFAVRSSLPRQSLEAAVRAELATTEPNLPLFNVRMMSDAVSNGLGGWRLVVMLLSAFAIIALLLSAMGIFAVISFSVSQRTHEIGVRVAMGAQRGKILSMILGQGVMLTGIGVALGAVLAYFLTRYLVNLRLEIDAAQPITYGLVTLFLVAVTLVACSVPAWRATRVSPMDALREE